MSGTQTGSGDDSSRFTLGSNGVAPFIDSKVSGSGGELNGHGSILRICDTERNWKQQMSLPMEHNQDIILISLLLVLFIMHRKYEVHMFIFFSEGGCPSLVLENDAIEYSRCAVSGKCTVTIVATFTCETRCFRFGSSSVTCESSGNWNQHTPTCKPSKPNNVISPIFMLILFYGFLYLNMPPFSFL